MPRVDLDERDTAYLGLALASLNLEDQRYIKESMEPREDPDDEALRLHYRAAATMRIEQYFPLLQKIGGRPA